MPSWKIKRWWENRGQGLLSQQWSGTQGNVPCRVWSTGLYRAPPAGSKQRPRGLSVCPWQRFPAGHTMWLGPRQLEGSRVEGGAAGFLGQLQSWGGPCLSPQTSLLRIATPSPQRQSCPPPGPHHGQCASSWTEPLRAVVATPSGRPIHHQLPETSHTWKLLNTPAFIKLHPKSISNKES